MSLRPLPRRAPLLVVLAILLSLLAAPAARACSCFLGDPRDALANADGAFIGTLTDVRTVSDDPAYADYTFEVETAVKGPLGTTLELRAGSTDASCAFDAQPGDRVGAFLSMQDGRWWSGLCSQIDPELLLRAAAPLPAPDGHGRARFVLGINLGDTRLMSLDARGHTLAYGEGDGLAVDVDLCPGSRRVVEGARVARTGLAVLREVPSLRVLLQVEVVGGPRSPRVDVACLTRSGDRILAVERHAGEHWVHELRGTEDRVVWHGPARSVTIDGGRVLVLGGRRVSELGLRTGRLTPFAVVPTGASELAVSPGVPRVAGIVVDRWTGASALFATERSAGTTERFALDTLYASGTIAWLDDRRFVYLPGDGSRAFVIQAATMEPVAGFDGWFAGASTVSGRTAYGSSFGYLIAAGLGDGEIRVLRIFDSPETGVLAVAPRSPA
jgi:hypothetical protein